MRARPSVAAVGLLLAVASGCASTTPAPDGSQPESSQTIPPALELDDEPPRDPRQVLTLVPESATVLTISNHEAIREAGLDSVPLTDGLLPGDDSPFLLEHGFSQGDLDWEARFSGPDGEGYALAFRPDLDMSLVRAALKERLLRGARVLAEEHLLVKGTADEGDPVWAMDEGLRTLTEPGAESTYLRRACVPLRDALGPGATDQDQERLVAEADPTYLRPLEAFSVSFDDQVATARLGLDRPDLHQRAHLVSLWPRAKGIGVEDGFEGLAVADPSTGRIGLRVADPVAAARLTRTGILPFAVCNGV